MGTRGMELFRCTGLGVWGRAGLGLCLAGGLLTFALGCSDGEVAAGVETPDATATGGDEVVGTGGASTGGNGEATGGSGGVSATGGVMSGATGGADGATGGTDADAAVPFADDFDFSCPALAADTDPLPPEGERVAELVQGQDGLQLEFLEGPVWFQGREALFFSDMLVHNGTETGQGPPARMYKLDSEGAFSVFVAEANSNGLAIGPEGDILAATHDMQTLSHFDPDTGDRDALDMLYNGANFNSPNDLAVRSDGTVFFTDPHWQRADRTGQADLTGVFRRAPDGTITLLDPQWYQPNGITLSPDERSLYVSAGGSAGVRRYTVDAAGDLSEETQFAAASAGVDGMAVDCLGNLYVTDGEVRVYSPAGDVLGAIAVGQTPTNVAFGGVDRKTLYITTGSGSNTDGTGLYSIQLGVPGSPY